MFDRILVNCLMVLPLFRYVAPLSYQIETDQVFILPLSPSLFNLSQENFSDEFSYTASLQDMPDLPKWLQVVHSTSLRIGFLLGTPHYEYAGDSIVLEVTATNLVTFEASVLEMNLEIVAKQAPSIHQVKLKIHNFNLEDFMEKRKQDRLLNVFREVLWPASANDIHLVELYSALLAGGRRPARKQDGEGVILTLGSAAKFSDVMRELEREVSPLWPLRNCPRDFKKTSAERHFRTKGFLVDWCSFKLVPQNVSLIQISSTPSTHLESKTNKNFHQFDLPSAEDIDFGLWIAPAKWEIPRRSYVEEGIVAIFIPLVILLILAGLLTAVLGVHPEGSETEEGQLYEAVFEELPFMKSKTPTAPSATAEKTDLSGPGFLAEQPKSTRTFESTTPSLNRIKRNPLFDLSADSVPRGSSPFLMSNGSSSSPTPVSTLNRSSHTFRSTHLAPEKSSTLGRPEPPPYTGTLRK